MAASVLSHQLRAAEGVRAPAARPAKRAAAVAVKAHASDAPRGAARVAAAALATLASPAHAASSAASASVAQSVQSAFDTANGFASQAADVAGEVAGSAKVAADFLRPYVDAATPVVVDAARSTVNAATPIVQQTLKSAARAAQDNGVDVDGAIKTATAAAKATAPVAQEAVSAAAAVSQALINGDPATLTTAAGLAALALLLSPLIVPAIATALRGYTNDLTPAKVLDLLSQTDGVLVDIRKSSEVEAKGSPALPKGQGGKLVRVEFDTIADRTLRSAINDPVAVEADSTARIIAALKKVSKGKPVVILDANASLAKLVARKVAALGFRSVYVVDGGFDGRSGWVGSGLSVAAAASSNGARPFSGLPIPGTVSARK